MLRRFTAVCRLESSAVGCRISHLLHGPQPHPFAGFHSAACILASPGSGLPKRDLPVKFSTDLPARLQSGGIFPSEKADYIGWHECELLIHWATLPNFKDFLLPDVSFLIRRDQPRVGRLQLFLRK
jgi:hypothetical protein